MASWWISPHQWGCFLPGAEIEGGLSFAARLEDRIREALNVQEEATEEITVQNADDAPLDLENDFDLQAQTEEQRAQQEAEIKAAAEAEAKAKRKADEAERKRKEQEADKARADETVDSFELGQSSEEAMSGMSDIFSQQAQQTQPPGQAEAIERHQLPASTTFTPAAGLAKGKWIAKAEGQSSNPADTIDEAAQELKQWLNSAERGEQSEKARQKLSADVAAKVKQGKQPTDSELFDLFGLEPHHTYVDQAAVGWWLVENFNVPRNRIKASLGAAGGTLTTDGGSQRNIVYPRKLHEVFGQQQAEQGQSQQTQET